jgi:endonuclease/exonuclease/phosphatase family metal-dependent hydrolase
LTVTLQVVTYNLGGAKHLRGDRFDYPALADDAVRTLMGLIDPAQPTVIALQEVGWGLGAARRYDAAAQIAAGLGAGYRHAFAAELTRRNHPHAGLWGRPAFAGLTDAAEGNALVTNLPPAPWPWPTLDPDQDWALSASIGRPALYSTGSRDTQPRNAQVASLRLADDLALFVVNTHLTTLKGENRHDSAEARAAHASRLRGAEADALLSIADELDAAEQAIASSPCRPLLLLGDFNARPDSPELARLARRFRLLRPDNDAESCWSHLGHRILIDHLLLHDPAGRLIPTACTVVADLPAADLSDHRPVLARLALSEVLYV